MYAKKFLKKYITDPPKDGKKRRSNTAKVYGLPGQRVYTNSQASKVTVDKEGNETFPGRGDLVRPSANLHKETGVHRKGHGQVRRPVDASKSPYTKNIKRGSKGVRANKK